MGSMSLIDAVPVNSPGNFSFSPWNLFGARLELIDRLISLAFFHWHLFLVYYCLRGCAHDSLFLELRAISTPKISLDSE